MKKYWYEVFIDKGIEGTETIEGHENLGTAKNSAKDYRANGLRVGIDKWTFVNGVPENIDLIEEVC